MQPAKQDSLEVTNLVFRRLIKWILISVVVYAMTILLTVYFAPSVTLAMTGTFGDSFGILTAMFSGLAFAGLIWTILLQREELRLQREELKENRRQAVISRLATVIQNQTAGYRSEIAPLQFRDIAGTGYIGLHEMLHSTSSHLEKLVEDNKAGKLDSTEHLTRVTDYLTAILSSLNSHQTLIGGLARCCRGNRHLLTNDALSADDAMDLKALFFAELPANLLGCVFQLGEMVKVYVAFKAKCDGFEPTAMDPVRRLQFDCERILGHQALRLTEETLAADRKRKWVFAA